jgi:hypothetical protein
VRTFFIATMTALCSSRASWNVQPCALSLLAVQLQYRPIVDHDVVEWPGTLSQHWKRTSQNAQDLKLVRDSGPLFALENAPNLLDLSSGVERLPPSASLARCRVADCTTR